MFKAHFEKATEESRHTIYKELRHPSRHYIQV